MDVGILLFSGGKLFLSSCLKYTVVEGVYNELFYTDGCNWKTLWVYNLIRTVVHPTALRVCSLLRATTVHAQKQLTGSKN